MRSFVKTKQPAVLLFTLLSRRGRVRKIVLGIEIMILFTVIFGLNAIVAFVGNLLVLLVVKLYRRFHKMRYCLLASMALSDCLSAILITSNRTVATALEQWPFSITWCRGAVFILRVLHLSTVFHLCAVSYERYTAIVRKPLTYIGNITKERVFLNIALLWVLQAVISLGPFIRLGDYVYNPEIFFCEQKWDWQRAFIVFITLFLIPLGIIIFLNYRLLKVVRRLQRSVRLFSDLSTTENKTKDCLTQQQSCSKNDQYQDPNQQHPKKVEGPGGIENDEHGNTPQIQNVTVKLVLPCGMQDEETSAYLTDPDEITEAIHGDSHTTQYRSDEAQYRSHEAQYRSREAQHRSPSRCHSYSLAERPNNPSFVKTRLNGQSKIYKEVVEIGRSKEKIFHDPKDQRTRRQVAEYEQDKLAKIHIQIDTAQKDQSFQQRQNAATLKDNNGFQERSLTSQTQIRKGKSGFPGIGRTLNKVSANNAVGVKTEVSNSRSERPPLVEKKSRSLKRKTKDGPECVIQVSDQPATELMALGVYSREEKCLTSYINQGTLLNNHEEGQKSKIIAGGPSQIDTLQLTNNHAPKQSTTPGKTQRILVKLLREGKAAKDVMIIIGAFVLCYLPLCIMALYRSLGGRPSAETILSILSVYSLSMVCNPIIYSVRKKEFRKALKKMLKL